MVKSIMDMCTGVHGQEYYGHVYGCAWSRVLWTCVRVCMVKSSVDMCAAHVYRHVYGHVYRVTVTQWSLRDELLRLGAVEARFYEHAYAHV